MAPKGLFDLSKKVALVTGASRGLGRIFAEAVAEFGADVACAGRDEAKLQETLGILKQYGHRAVAIKADITRDVDIKRMVDEAVAKLGKIDILFNNAGTVTPLKRVHELAIEDWDRVINTNLRGQFLTLKYVLPVMIKNKGGSIINIASIAGLRAEVPEVAPASYGASKAGIINLTQVAAMEYVKDRIRVNCIAPGMHKTELGRHPDQLIHQESLAEVEKFITKYCAKEVPMGRIGEAAELKGLAVLLASDASSYITGQVFVEDGGQSARI